jgi:parallel beta-helix repeat protein
MRFTSRIVIILSIIAVLGSALTAGYLMTIRQNSHEEVYPHVRRTPMSIYAASDFTPPGSATGCACVVAGSGSAADPYVIAGWDIDASETDGISVAYVDSYFLITQVNISGTRQHAAIRMEQVSNGKVSDSEIAGAFRAISIHQSKNIAVFDNRISESEFGTWLEASNFCTVVGNTMKKIRQVSIFVRGSDNSVEGNSVAGTYGGINIDGMPGHAERNVIKNNTITAAQEYGIGLWQADANTVISNIISDGGGSGILITDSSDSNTIESNGVRQNAGDGILIVEGSSNNLVQRNVCAENGDGVYTFDLHSEVPDNIWQNNTFGTRNVEALE